MTSTKNNTKISKFLSLVLRHKPEIIGVELNQQGWIDIDLLIQKMNANGKTINRQMLEEVVASNNKKRFIINVATNQIRANQGHSLNIDLGYQPQTPPKILYHGTAQKFIDSIYKTGLQKRNRHHVHLTDNLKTANQVGQRHGKVVILQVQAEQMHQKGFEFFVSENHVWLTDNVPTQFIEKLTS